MKRLLVSRSAVALLAATMFCQYGPTCAFAEKKEKVKPADLPASIKKAVEEKYPKAEFVEIEKEVEGEDPGQFDLTIRAAGKDVELEISPKGKIKEAKEVSHETKSTEESAE